jgi:Tol biopolymer transport system component
MKKTLITSLLLLTLAYAFSGAQETYFGKNKVRYKDFDWSYIQTRHFDIHFYEDAYPTAQFASAVLESAYVEISHELNYLIQRRVPIFIYNSNNDFQQTNIISSLIPEGVGGFTEMFKNRIVVPFSGSYEDFRHVLHHELTHAVTFDLLYGNALSSLISRQRLFSMPLWLAEGYAEYSSRHGWDYSSDMYVRDATINNYLTPPQFLEGFLAYKQGQAMIKFIAEKYGEEKLGTIFRKGKVHLTMNKALKEAIGIDEKQLWEEFSKEMKRRYWPEIAVRKEVAEVAKQLTHSREDGSYFNEKPEFSPDGGRLAVFTDKSDYTEIVLISAEDGKVIDRLVKGERSADLESLHWYVSGISFSPDGRSLVFVAKSGGKDAILFYDLSRKKVYKKKKLDFFNILSPSWSPDGNKIAFSALKGHKRDLFVYFIESDRIKQLTDDRYDDSDPSWLPNSNQLVFVSDRPHPENPILDPGDNAYVGEGAYMPGDLEYGYYNLFRIDLLDPKVAPLNVGPGANTSPAVSPDGEKVAFISNRNGIDNIYIGYLDSVVYYAVTDILTSVGWVSWSPDGQKIAFSAFNKGGFDIFVLKDLVPVGENGILAPTDFMLGKYDLLRNRQASQTLAAHQRQGDRESDAATEIAPSDSTATDSAIVEPESAPVSHEEETDSTITETGIYDEEYVFVRSAGNDPLDSLLIDIPDDTTTVYQLGQREPLSFDSIPPPTPSGDYETKKYKVKFTPDYVGGGFAYDSYFGLRGQSYFVFSDYLGNHQIYIATDLVNTIDQSFLQAYYFYNRKRVNVGFGLFHTKNFYLDSRDYLFSDRFYGLQLFLSRPFSVFSRLEFFASQYFIDREYVDFDDPRLDRSSKVTTSELAYVTDNIIWGITGPVNGRRARLSLSGGVNLFDASDIEFVSVDFDYRKYWHFKKTFSMAFRLAGGVSFGETPKLYFLGGTTNWIGNRTLDAKVYEVENLYFADVVTPLRGVPYYELSGNRYALMNWEFRFPMIEYFAMCFPLPLVISKVVGVVFTDMGAAWYNDNFKGGTTANGHSRLQDIHTGFGFGMRANLGFVVLRYDLAWSTDFYHVSDKPSYYFSLGADF